MTDLKTPYLDSEINGMKFMVRDNSLSVIGTEKLAEYQQIKAALKRLGELEEENKDLKRQLIEGAEIVSIKNNSGDINFC